MKASFLVAAAGLAIAASAAPSTAQEKSGRWSPPIKLSTMINSDSIKEGPVISKEEEEGKEHNRCSQHHFGPFSDWSEPVWLGPIVNSSVDDLHPAISHNGLSLYITLTNRPGGFGNNDIWVSQRATLDDPWGPPQNLGPNINTADSEFAPDFSPDGHWLFFSSTRGMLSAPKIWVSYRKDADDDFGWGPAVKLRGDINVAGLDDNAPTFFHDRKTGTTSIYFKDPTHTMFAGVKAGTYCPGNGCPDGIHYAVKGNLWAQMARLGGIVEIDLRGIILGFVPIPNGDLATTNFAFGGPDNQYIYFEGANTGTFWRFKAPYPGLIGPGGVRLAAQP